VLNFTATEAGAGTFLTVFPAGQARPDASNLNVVPGQDVPNLVVAKVGSNGNVTIYNNRGLDARHLRRGGLLPRLSSPGRPLATRRGRADRPGRATRTGARVDPVDQRDLRVPAGAADPAQEIGQLPVRDRLESPVPASGAGADETGKEGCALVHASIVRFPTNRQ